MAGYAQSSDGDVPGIHGKNAPDAWVVKLDDHGNKVWSKTVGGTGYDYIYGVAANLNGGFAIAGFTLSTDGDITGNHGHSDAWVVTFKDN